MSSIPQSNPTPQGETNPYTTPLILAALSEWLKRQAITVQTHGSKWVIYTGNTPRASHDNPYDAYMGALNLAAFPIALSWDEADARAEVDHE